MQDNILNNESHFTINDILLPVDPQSISVFKEGLDWGGSTLRDKVSARVLSGNGVFNVQVSIIFTKVMYLHLHRLICQVRNSPYVYIENKYINEQVDNGLGRGKLFAVSSFQLVPMQNSPGTFICELNLVYVNESVFTSSLLYKEDVLNDYSDKEVSSFSIFEEDQVIVFNKTAAEKRQISSSARKKKRNIENVDTSFLKTKAVGSPIESNAFVKYGNFLQIKSLRKNFAVSSKKIKSIFNQDLLKLEGGHTEDKSRKAYGLHSSKISKEARIALIELMIQGREDDFSLLFEEYKYLRLSAGESSKYRSKLSFDVPKSTSREDKTKLLGSKKVEVFKDILNGNDSSLKRKIDALDKEGYAPYLERPEYRNLFYRKHAYVIKNGNPNGQSDTDEKVSLSIRNTIVTNISAGFRPNLSIIPISGSKFPTVQFLGGVEPVYQVDILSKSSGTLDSLAEGVKRFDATRDLLQKNSIDFKIIPDSGYASIDCFISRLLGTYEEEDYAPELDKPLKKRVVFKSMTNSTVEGSPGTSRASMVFVESKSYDTEKIKPIRSTKSFSKDRTVKRLSKTTFTKTTTVSTSSNNAQGETKYHESWYAKTSLDGINSSHHEALNELRDITLRRLNFIQIALTACFGANTSFIITRNGKLEKIERDKARTTASNHFVNSAVDIKLNRGSKITHYELVNFIQALREYGYLGKDPGLQENNLFIQLYHNGNKKEGAFIHIDHRMKLRGRVTKNGDGKITDVNYSTILEKNSSSEFINNAGPKNAFYSKNRKTGTIVKSENFNQDLINKYKKLIEEKKLTTNGVVELDIEITIDEEEIEIEESLIEEFDLNQALTEFKNQKRISSLKKDFTIELKSLSKELKTKIKETFGNEGANPIQNSDQIDVFANNEEVKKILRSKGVRYIENGNKIYIAKKEATYISKLEQDTEAQAIITMLENFNGLASLMLTEPGYYVEQGEKEAELKRIKDILGEEKLAPSMMLYSMYLLNKLLENYNGSSTFKVVVSGITVGVGVGLATLTTGGLALAGGAIAFGGASRSGSLAGAVDGTNVDRIKMHIDEEVKYLGSLVSKEDLNVINEIVKSIPSELNFDAYDLNTGETFQNAINELSLKAFLENPYLKQFKELHTRSKSRALIASAIGFTEIEKGEDSELTTIAPLVSYKEVQQYLTALAAIPVEDEYGIDDSRLNEVFYLQFEKGTNLENSVYTDTGNKENYYFPTLGKTWNEYEKLLNDVNLKIPSCINQWEVGSSNHISFNNFFSEEEIKENQEQKIAYLKNLKETLIKSLIANPEVKKALGIEEDELFGEILSNEDTCYPDIDKPLDPRFKNRLLDPWFFYYDIVEENSTGLKYLQKRRDDNVETIINKSLEFEKAIQQGLLNSRSTESGLLINEIKSLPEVDLIDARVRDISEGSFDVKGTQIGEEAIQEVNTEEEVILTDPNGTEREAPEIKFKDVFGRKVYSQKEKDLIKKETSETSKALLQPFSKENLVEGSKISNKNFLQDRRSYKKMFPTFKLYFVEEDAVESDEFFIFDDFFSYNGVRSFSFYNNKKLAATTAQISLQNISGILDGTKPFVGRDVDLRQDVLGDEELDLANNIQSIIVRPGLNVQLRAGYSENASELKVLLSGRITEVQWSSGGDICDIIVQSYGVELVNKKFGVGINDPLSSKTFYNTHTLLGNLALNESLKHFGRYKKGRAFQVGENKELSVDLGNYKDDNWFTPIFSEGVAKWLYEHKIGIAIGAVLLDAGLAFVPLKFTNGLGNFVKGAFTKTATTAGVKATTTTSATAILLSSILGGIKTKAGQNAVLQSIGAGISSFSRATAGKIVGAAKIINTTINGFFTRSATSKVIAQIEKNILPGIKADINGILKRQFNGKALGELTEAELKTLFNSLREVSLPGQVKAGWLLAIKNFLSTSKSTLGSLGAQNLSGEALVAELTKLLGTRSLIKAGIHPAYSIKGGMTSFFQNAGYDLLSRLPRSMASGYMKFVGIGLILDTLISAGISVKNWLYNAWREKTNPRTLKLLLEPQDDNLYPPEPSMYLKKTPQTISRSIGIFLNKIWGTILNSVNIATLGSTGGLQEALKNYEIFLDKRLSIDDGENEYTIRNSTIWEMFEEMTLRHPGWIAAARPYGQGMEYRLFFGVPDQRWWSKPISNTLTEYLNKISNAYLNSKNGTFIEIGKELFPNSSGFDQTKLGMEAVSFWNKNTEERNVPFRKYHYVRSGINLISNKLRVESGIINEVAVAYENTKSTEGSSNDGINSGKQYSIRNIRGSQHIPEELINSKNIGEYPNIKGAVNAFRYGYSSLINNAKMMYSGEILVLGAPNIEPHDVCILNDNYSDMHGPIEVEAVTHLFSQSTGFITEITPNAIAFGNEQMTAPSLVSTIVGLSQQKLLEKYPNLSRLGNKADLISDIVEDQMTEYFSGTDNFVGKMLFNLFNDSDALNGQTKGKIIEQIQTNIREGNLRGLESIIQGGSIKGVADTAVEGALNLTAVAAGSATLIQAARSAILNNAGIATLNQATTSGFGLGPNGLSRGAITIALGAVVANVFFRDAISAGIDDSFRNGKLGSKLFNNMMLNKVSEGSVVRIVPVIKYGKPVLAGGYEKANPKNSYKIVLGEYRNLLSDAIDGYEKKKAEYEELAELAGFKNLERETTSLGKLTRIGIGLGKVVGGGALQQAWLRGGVSDMVAGVTGEMSPGAINAFIQKQGAE